MAAALQIHQVSHRLDILQDEILLNTFRSRIVSQSWASSSGIVARSFGFLFRHDIIAQMTSCGTGTLTISLSFGGGGGESPLLCRGGGGLEYGGNLISWFGSGIARILNTGLLMW